MLVRLAGLALSVFWAVMWRPGGPWGHGAKMLLAQAVGPTASDAVIPLLAGSPFGVCLVLVMIGWLVPKPSVDRLERFLASTAKQRDDLAAQLAEVIPVLALINATVLPSIERTNTAIDRHTEELRRLSDLVRTLVELVRELRAARRSDGA